MKTEAFKILIVSPLLPYPPNEGASIRIYNIIKQLSQRHEVHLAAFTMSPANRENIAMLQQVCKTVWVVELKRTFLKKLFELLFSPFSRRPYLANIYESKEMRKIVEQLAAKVDIAQAEFPYVGKYIADLGCKKVLDEHNVEWDVQRRMAKTQQNPMEKIGFFIQYRKMQCFERELVRGMDAVITTSVHDRELLEAYNSEVYVIPNCMNQVYEPVTVENKIITFVGLMNYRPNTDAILYFSTSIWPLLKKTDQEIRLFVVGKNPTEKVRRLNGNGITVTGTVDDVTDYLRNTAIFIAPIRMGGGTRIKIIEAMAHGIAVVSTSMGCMGIDVTDGKDILIADDPQSFAAKVLHLIANREDRMRIGINGHELVKTRYTWSGLTDKLERVYESGN